MVSSTLIRRNTASFKLKENIYNHNDLRKNYFFIYVYIYIKIRQES